MVKSIYFEAFDTLIKKTFHLQETRHVAYPRLKLNRLVNIYIKLNGTKLLLRDYIIACLYMHFSSLKMRLIPFLITFGIFKCIYAVSR